MKMSAQKGMERMNQRPKKRMKKLMSAALSLLMVLSLLFCALQAIVFTTLVSIYLQEATE